MITVGVKAGWAGRSLGFLPIMKNCTDLVEFATVDDAIAHTELFRGQERRIYRDREIIAEWAYVKDRKTGKRSIYRVK